jgi:hypothetical protein
MTTQILHTLNDFGDFYIDHSTQIETRNDFGDFYIDHSTGETFLSIHACAELVQAYPTAITRISNRHNFGKEIAVISSSTGLKTVTLFTETEYVVIFAEPAGKNKLANQLLQALATVGASFLIQQQACFEISVTNPTTGKTHSFLTTDDYFSLVDFASLVDDLGTRGFFMKLGSELAQMVKTHGKKNLYPATLISESYESPEAAYAERWRKYTVLNHPTGIDYANMGQYPAQRTYMNCSDQIWEFLDTRGIETVRDLHQEVLQLDELDELSFEESLIYSCYELLLDLYDDFLIKI